MGVPPALRALSHRDFRLFWAGQAVSVVGSWMQTVGQAWLVLDLTGSPFRLGLVSTFQFAPLLLLGLVTGAVIDRVSKRRLVLATQVAFMLPALTLAALTWTRSVRYWHVATLAAIIGVVNALDMPGRQAFIAEMVGRDDILNAIALNSAVFNLARVLGPAAGGLLIARFGVAPAFLLNALSFLPVILALFVMRPPDPPSPRRTTLGREIGDGLRYAACTPPVALVLSLVLVVSTFAINHTVTVPLIARDILRQGADGFGLLMAALGAGALLGAILMAVLGGKGRPPLGAVIGPAVLLTGSVSALAAVRQFGLAAGVLFGVGLTQIMFLTSCNTTVQVAVPDELRGRVMSLYALVFAGVTPIGAFLVGSVAETFGVAAACGLGGGLAFALVLAQAGRFYRAQGRLA